MIGRNPEEINRARKGLGEENPRGADGGQLKQVKLFRRGGK